MPFVENDLKNVQYQEIIWGPHIEYMKPWIDKGNTQMMCIQLWSQIYNFLVEKKNEICNKT